MATEERPRVFPPPSWLEQWLLGVMLVWVAIGASDVVRLRPPAGKVEGVRQTGLAVSLGLVVGLAIAYLPRQARRVVAAAAVGAIVGFLAAILTGRCLVGFEAEPNWPELNRAIRSALAFTLPAGVVCGWLAERRLARLRRRAGAPGQLSHAPGPASRPSES
jgi:hypothetical protein